MGLMRQLFGPSRAEMWRELGRQIDAAYVDGGFWKGDKVVATTGPWTVTLDTYTVSTGKSHITYTRLRAPYLNRDGFRFELYRASLFNAVAVYFGMQDIQIGDAEFDRQFILKGNDESQVRKLLSNHRVRELLLKQPAIYLKVADDEGWFGQQFPEGVDELYFQVVGVIKDVDRLKSLFDLFSETLHTLCEIGSAYEAAPFEPMEIPAADRLLRASDASEGHELLRPATGQGEDDPNRLVRATEESETSHSRGPGQLG